MNFTPDDAIHKVAEGYALDASDFFRDQFQIKLDWSDASIQQVESVMGIFHEQLASARPSNEQIMDFAKLFGSYIGEVYRRNHGATWGMIEANGQRFPGLKALTSGKLFWPWGRARDRLVGGAENNIWHYYQEIVQEEA